MIKRVRRELGWAAKRTRYCAMIAEAKRAEWYKEQIRAGDLSFNNVVWTDEYTVQLELPSCQAKSQNTVTFALHCTSPIVLQCYSAALVYIFHLCATTVALVKNLLRTMKKHRN